MPLALILIGVGALGYIVYSRKKSAHEAFKDFFVMVIADNITEETDDYGNKTPVIKPATIYNGGLGLQTEEDALAFVTPLLTPSVTNEIIQRVKATTPSMQNRDYKIQIERIGPPTDLHGIRIHLVEV